ncbi:hypothetical protein C8F04DRAFT_1187631 [Mycena alexandri]|uniref:Uncharacterized protein n=1 Tax=Mycena alexandri TaxID=1745969 RepID=A0AAD6SM07_9AGAR|nr:hypothetical protein C8F04DRAFT_1187631 [Mycena alexandri]
MTHWATRGAVNHWCSAGGFNLNLIDPLSNYHGGKHTLRHRMSKGLFKVLNVWFLRVIQSERIDLWSACSPLTPDDTDKNESVFTPSPPAKLSLITRVRNIQIFAPSSPPPPPRRRRASRKFPNLPPPPEWDEVSLTFDSGSDDEQLSEESKVKDDQLSAPITRRVQFVVAAPSPPPPTPDLSSRCWDEEPTWSEYMKYLCNMGHPACEEYRSSSPENHPRRQCRLVKVKPTGQIALGSGWNPSGCSVGMSATKFGPSRRKIWSCADLRARKRLSSPLKSLRRDLHKAGSNETLTEGV